MDEAPAGPGVVAPEGRGQGPERRPGGPAEIPPSAPAATPATALTWSCRRGSPTLG